MPKPELEFFRPDHLPWQPVGGSTTGGAGGEGVMQKILSHDARTGDVTRLLRFDAGVETKETITHDFWEEVWIVEGTLVDLGKGQTFTAGMYACRPPGMIHGPYRVPAGGCVTFEIRYGKQMGGQTTMADEIRRVDYFYVQVPNKPGEGARALNVLREAGVNLLAFSGFPAGRGAQMDFVPEDAAAFRQVARKAKWKLTGPKKAFLVAGDDRPGVVADVMQRLADAKINVTAIDAVCAGTGRYGAILWVAPKDVTRAAKVLGAR